MIELLRAATGRRIRRTRNSSVEILSGRRTAPEEVAPAPPTATPPKPATDPLGDDFIPF